MSKKVPHLKNRRARIFAGPNGSGKSSVFEMVANTFDVGIYINADEIEKTFHADQGLNLADFGIPRLSKKEFEAFLALHPLAVKARNRGFSVRLRMDENQFVHAEGKVNSYQAALLSDLIRNKLIEQGTKFTFETVMSDVSKIELIKRARQNGFKTYLYFVCTISPEINADRVKYRVENGGHPVPEDLIFSRYERSLLNLKDAISNSYRAFLWDNSGTKAQLVLEVFQGKDMVLHSEQIPNWVQKYYLNRL